MCYAGVYKLLNSEREKFNFKFFQAIFFSGKDHRFFKIFGKFRRNLKPSSEYSTRLENVHVWISLAAIQNSFKHFEKKELKNFVRRA